jgi:TonB family protein
VVDEDAFESESAVLLSAPAAEYPAAVRETGAWAKITVGFTIDATGIVRDPRIESSWVKGEAPESAFVEAALAAARTARFEPARERGIPTSSWSTLTFTFEAGPL